MVSNISSSQARKRYWWELKLYDLMPNSRLLTTRVHTSSVPWPSTAWLINLQPFSFLLGEGDLNNQECLLICRKSLLLSLRLTPDVLFFPVPQPLAITRLKVSSNGTTAKTSMSLREDPQSCRVVLAPLGGESMTIAVPMWQALSSTSDSILPWHRLWHLAETMWPCEHKSLPSPLLLDWLCVTPSALFFPSDLKRNTNPNLSSS